MDRSSYRIGTFVLILTLLLSTAAFADGLRVHFLDVGQGDAILLQQEDSNVVIDGGDRWGWVAEKVVGYLEDQDVESLNAVVGIHPHVDHIGVLAAVIEAFPVPSCLRQRQGAHHPDLRELPNRDR